MKRRRARIRRWIFRRLHHLQPDEFRSPFHDEPMKFWKCSTHDRLCIGYVFGGPPHHCIGAWDDPETDCCFPP